MVLSSVTHGNTAARKPVHAPLSRSFDGPFGRMFRNLVPWEPEGKNEAEKIEFIGKIAAEMADPDDRDKTRDNPEIPAGYTYFGQFVDHDLTFDPRSSLQKLNDPDNLDDFRTPAFDLDCIYGRGPSDQPYMYEADGSFRIDKNGADEDLPRHKDTALIGDKRNDENTFVSQIQLTFLKFHNEILKTKGKGDFSETQRIVRWHYQWVVIHDWLKRLCGKKLVDAMLAGDCCGSAKLCFYKYEHYPFMPVEFSAAAYRLGHSMIRGGYAINPNVRLPTFKSDDVVSPTDDFRGFKKMPPGWTIQWSRFFDFSGQPGVVAADLQLSRKLDRFLAGAIVKMPKTIADPNDVPAPEPIARSLAMRNLLRSWRLSLPSGQAVAARICAGPTKVPNTPELPLWRYILEEAQLDQNGLRLGEVGARIVAETFIGLLQGDPTSYFRVSPKWTPEFKSIGPNFEMRDIIKLAKQKIA
jgi:hypothetical protein